MIKAVIFDVGGVFTEWIVRYLYRKMFSDEASIDTFLTKTDLLSWNYEWDKGANMEQGVEKLADQHPEYREHILAFWSRWPEMLAGEITGTIGLFYQLKARNVPLYILSNWAAETWPSAEKVFPFLTEFDDKIVSGFEGMAKPDPAIFKLAEERFQVTPAETLFIDDMPGNTAAAQACGFQVHRFVNPKGLEEDLKEYGLI